MSDQEVRTKFGLRDDADVNRKLIVAVAGPHPRLLVVDGYVSLLEAVNAKEIDPQAECIPVGDETLGRVIDYLPTPRI